LTVIGEIRRVLCRQVEKPTFARADPLPSIGTHGNQDPVLGRLCRHAVRQSQGSRCKGLNPCKDNGKSIPTGMINELEKVGRNISRQMLSNIDSKNTTDCEPSRHQCSPSSNISNYVVVARQIVLCELVLKSALGDKNVCKNRVLCTTSKSFIICAKY
jgi:hypothetical protein